MSATTALGNNALNISSFPYSGMNTNNFIEILYKNFLDKGWEGLTLLFILQLYMALSLERIQDLFKYINDKVSEHGKAKLESYFLIISNFCGTYIEGSVIKLYIFIVNHLSKFFKPKINLINIDKITTPNFILKSDNMNKFVLNIDNRIDIMSVCCYLFQNRDKLQINDMCTRSESSQRYTSEIYHVPSELEIGDKEVNSFDSEGDVGIRFVQNINLQITVESNHSDHETVKDYSQGTEKIQTHISFKDVFEFETFINAKIPALTTELPLSGYPDLIINNWQSSPISITNRTLSKFWILIYLSKNAKLLEAAIRFVCGEPFKFEGRTYILTLPMWDGLNGGKASPGINSTLSIKDLQTTLDSYYREELIHFITSCVPGTIGTATGTGTTNSYIKELMNVAQNLVNQHGVEPPSNSDIFIEFRSETLTNCDLDNYARRWMWTRIQSYYHDTQKREGDKITIYKMDIQYTKETIEVNNPAFQDWLDRNSFTEEEYDKMQDEKKKKEEDAKGEIKQSEKDNKENEIEKGKATDTGKTTNNKKDEDSKEAK